MSRSLASDFDHSSRSEFREVRFWITRLHFTLEIHFMYREKKYYNKKTKRRRCSYNHSHSDNMTRIKPSLHGICVLFKCVALNLHSIFHSKSILADSTPVLDGARVTVKTIIKYGFQLFFYFIFYSQSFNGYDVFFESTHADKYFFWFCIDPDEINKKNF